MVVAVIGMLTMYVALHEEIDVTRVRDGFVPAGCVVTMRGIVPIAVVPTRTVRRICAGGDELVFVDVTFVRVMQVPVVEEVCMIFMLHFRMTATVAVLMLVRVVRWVRCHGGPPNLRLAIKPAMPLSEHHASKALWCLDPARACAHRVALLCNPFANVPIATSGM